ncbi:ribonuclease T2 [Pleomassaria siparia CBS 279.74]|uniref:Ribonuclease T2-like n=1 Tax=Pleomassaria siparia CBS 279.74 TaxID=1314801 RepID=A0A6G1K4F8_9PLEO|nr:ribonuclease T2 [Pleomassaria siparia CBS 279.74]
MASQIPSLRTISKLAIGGAQLLLGSGQTVLGGLSKTCSNPQLSCQNTTVVADLCCFNAPGGQLLQTQFWDTDPVTGPVDSWTVHGLWPDHCDGTYDANCDSSRTYTNISAIIKGFGKTDLLTYMQTYWKDYQGNDETLWEHEWAKHGTCISTLKTSCYTNYQPTEEAVDYFQKAIDLFKTLPSYTWLASAGITPSTTKTYTTAAIQAAIQAQRPGVSVTLGCSSGALNEIWYHYDVKGSLQLGTFVAANPDGTKSTCPATGIKYLPKGATTTGTTTIPSGTTTVPSGTSTPGTPFSGKGYLNVNVGSSTTTTGCVISAGTWYTSGTCATITATASGSGFTLKSSKGDCSAASGALVCASGTTATVFTAVDGKLATGGSTSWSADAQASGSTQQTIYSGTGHTTSISMVWQSI